jgi:hypothetical protein
VVLLTLSLAVTTVTSATWTAREQSSETVPIYFYLNFPDRSTREYWQGERIDLPTLQLWSRGLAAAIVDGSTMLRPVVTREEAKVDRNDLGALPDGYALLANYLEGYHSYFRERHSTHYRIRTVVELMPAC